MNLPSSTGRIAVRRLLVGLSLMTVLLAGCSTGGTPPVTDRSRVDNSTERRAGREAGRSAQRGAAVTGNSYRVVAGDTLYSIAWRAQRDFRDLAALNQITAPFDIYPGQVLKVKGRVPRRSATAAVSPARAQQSAQRSTQERRPASRPSKPHPLASTRTKPQSGPSINPAQTVGESVGKSVVAGASGTTRSTGSAKPVAKPVGGTQKSAAKPQTGPVRLRWPSSGKRLRGFGSKPAGSGKPSNTIDFALQPGAAILAAGAGEVVFAQAGLAGYRQFVILKHNDTWMSSYGFNAPLKVREGQRVAAGAMLATLARGAGTASERVLRFEVRKDGTAVNPDAVVR